MKNRLLIADDDIDICSIYKEVSEKCGFTVEIAHDQPAFQLQVAQFEPSLIILDLQFVAGDGVELLHYLSDHSFKGGILLISGQDSRLIKAVSDIGSALNLKMIEPLQKPVKLPHLMSVLKSQLPVEVDLSEDVIKEALNLNQFKVHYQPKVSLSSNRISGAEALIRCNYKDQSLIYPDSFITDIEQTDMITPLTYWLLDKVCEDLLALEDSDSMSFAINISAKLMEDIRFSDYIFARVNDLKIKPASLTFEITETQALKMPDIAINIVSRLRLRGFTVSIDDFGTGYSSLTSLYKMPFNELKIDKMFMGNLGQNNEARKIVKSIIDLAHTLGLTVVTEGVEDIESLRIIKEFGADYAQGYLISKPVPFNEFQALISTQELKEWYKI